MTDLANLTANLPFDITVEALAGLIMDKMKNLSVGQFRVRPVGYGYKTTVREVLNISGSGFDHEGKELIYFDINRTSLFDSLPEMLFHSQQSFEDTVEEAEFIATQREDARNFFLPFEEEFYKSRIEVELHERAVLKTLNLRMLQIFGFDLSEISAENQNHVLVYAFLMPFLNRIVGNMELTCTVLEVIVNKKVTVSLGASPTYSVPGELHSRVGTVSLGDSFLLGEMFSDGSRCLEFSICDVRPEELEEWIPGGALRKFVEEKLFPYILPAGENYNLNILTNDPGRGMVLGNAQASAILGYTVI